MQDNRKEEKNRAPEKQKKSLWDTVRRKETIYVADFCACIFALAGPRLIALWESGTVKWIVFYSVIILEILMLLTPALDCWAAAFQDAAPDDAAEQKARGTVYWHIALALLYAAVAVIVGARLWAA